MASHYELKAKLSEGPGGSVWKYKDTRSGHSVAIKRIDPGTSMDVGTVMNMLQAIKDNPHKNIAKLFRSCTDDVDGIRYNFIVYQYYSHGTLVDLLKRMGPLSIEYVRSVIRQVVAGIDHWHSKVGKRHGDIKLQNILFKNEEKTEIVIGDIGLELPEDLDNSVKKSILVGGTTDYLSYELLKEQKLGKPADVWAIGVITFVLLCNTTPFHFMTGKEMKKGVPKEIEVADDFSKETDNPIVKAANQFVQDALVKIEKGVDWSPFPENLEYNIAKVFISNLLDKNCDTRPTTVQALSHQFLDVSKLVKPAPANSALPASTASRSTQSKRLARKKRRRTKSPANTSTTSRHFDTITVSPKDKLLRSDHGSRQCRYILVRDGDSEFSLEDLSFWKQQTAIMQRVNIKAQLLLLLSVRAGYILENGKFKLVPVPRTWAESGLILPAQNSGREGRRGRGPRSPRASRFGDGYPRPPGPPPAPDSGGPAPPPSAPPSPPVNPGGSDPLPPLPAPPPRDSSRPPLPPPPPAPAPNTDAAEPPPAPPNVTPAAPPAHRSRSPAPAVSTSHTSKRRKHSNANSGHGGPPATNTPAEGAGPSKDVGKHPTDNRPDATSERHIAVPTLVPLDDTASGKGSKLSRQPSAATVSDYSGSGKGNDINEFRKTNQIPSLRNEHGVKHARFRRTNSSLQEEQSQSQNSNENRQSPGDEKTGSTTHRSTEEPQKTNDKASSIRGGYERKRGSRGSVTSLNRINSHPLQRTVSLSKPHAQAVPSKAKAQVDHEKEDSVKKKEKKRKGKERATDPPVIETGEASTTEQKPAEMPEDNHGGKTETGPVTTNADAGHPATSHVEFITPQDKHHSSQAPSKPPAIYVSPMGDKRHEEKMRRRQEKMQRNIEKVMKRRSYGDDMEISTISAGSSRHSSQSEEKKGKK